MATPQPPVPLIVYTGLAYRTIVGSNMPPIEDLVSDGDDERFSDSSKPTVYLATDAGVALAEMARHLAIGSDEPLDGTPQTLVRLRTRIEGIADIRETFTLQALGFPGGPTDLLDREAARDLGGRLREVPGCQGILAPSMALLDQPKRGNLVIFAERLPGRLESVLWPPREAGGVRFVPRPPDSY